LAAFFEQLASSINYSDQVAQIVARQIITVAAAIERFKLRCKKYGRSDKPDFPAARQGNASRGIQRQLLAPK